MSEQNKIPKGWVKCTIGTIYDFEYGKALKKEKRNTKGFVPVLGSNGVVGLHDDFLVKGPGIVVGRKGAAGEVTFVKEDFWPIDTTYYVKIKSNQSSVWFSYYLLKAQRLNQFEKSTAIPGLNRNDVYKKDILLPPLPEQHAIVSKIEQLFSELDKGIESLKTALQQLKVYRQSVLKWAFEGKLTNDNYRQGELPKGWKWIKVKDIGNIETGTTPSKLNTTFYGDDYPFFKPTDLEAGINVRAANDNLSKEGIEHARYLQSNSILVTCIGATIGKTGLIKVDGACNQQINSITPNDKYVSEFVYYQVISHWFQKQIKINAVATTLPILNKSKFEKLDFIYCPKEEQHQIVQQIESRLSECDNMEATISASLQQAEGLRQSILKKAFEGKLLNEGELQEIRNDPAWEPAERLLERIKAEKAGQQPKQSGRKRKVKA